MFQDIDYQKALNMINQELQKMKNELDEIDEMNLSGGKKKLAKCMKRIYKKLEGMVEIYAKTESHGDFNNICRELEALQPSFTLNYNEICYDNGLEKLNETLQELELELQKVDDMDLSNGEEEKVDHMHQIYDQIYEQVERFARSHDRSDFESASHQIEKLQPEFFLIYDELSH